MPIPKDTPPELTLQQKWTKLLSDAEQDLIGPREAIIGTREVYDETYGRNFGKVVTMLEEIDAKASRTTEDVTGMRGQLAQIVGKQPIILEHLERQAHLPEKLEAVASGVSALRSEFQAVGEIINGLAIDVGDLKQRMANAERTIEAHNQSRDASINERQQLRRDMADSQMHRAHMQEALDRLEAAVERIEQRQLHGPRPASDAAESEGGKVP